MAAVLARPRTGVARPATCPAAWVLRASVGRGRHGRPLRVSPAELDQLLLTPTRFPLEAVLPAWTRWAAARQNLPEEAQKALAE